MQILADVQALATTELSQFDLLVPIWSWGIVEPALMQRVLAAVHAGVGFATFHGGIDWFVDREYAAMIGGHFITHPAEHVVYRVEIESLDHPITKGLHPFEIQTEQFYFHVDPANTVLTTTRFADVIMPNTWVRTYGQGRVFYCSLAHTPEQIQQPEVLTLLLRGMGWAARSYSS